MFAGQSWQTSPELAARMFDAYRKYRSLHELMALLHTAIGQAATPAARELQGLCQRIDDLCESGVVEIDIATLRKQVLNRLRQLTCNYPLPADHVVER